MKILKPGKVEMRKFECDECGCVFTADWKDADRAGHIQCPEERCTGWCVWESGEPYEEPTPTQTLEDRLYGVLLTANPNATTTQLTDHLIANGVTFKEECDCGK